MVSASWRRSQNQRTVTRRLLGKGSVLRGNLARTAGNVRNI